MEEEEVSMVKAETSGSNCVLTVYVAMFANHTACEIKQQSNE